MALRIPGTSFNLPQSTFLLLENANFTEELIAMLQPLVHASDFWLPETLEKPVTMADIRSLIAFAARSAVGENKLAILPGADQFRQEVANALLKITEEPPERLTLLLLGESTHIPATLKSRVTILTSLEKFANIEDKGKQTVRQQIKELQSAYQLTDYQDLEKAGHLLYLLPLLHGTVQTGSILDALKSSQ